MQRLDELKYLYQQNWKPVEIIEDKQVLLSQLFQGCLIMLGQDLKGLDALAAHDYMSRIRDFAISGLLPSEATNSPLLRFTVVIALAKMHADKGVNTHAIFHSEKIPEGVKNFAKSNESFSEVVGMLAGDYRSQTLEAGFTIMAGQIFESLLNFPYNDDLIRLIDGISEKRFEAIDPLACRLDILSNLCYDQDLTPDGLFKAW